MMKNGLLLNNYTIRYDFLQGKEHLIVPVVLMVQGVHRGSHGPILHLAEELGKFPRAWDGIPVAVQHPEEDGIHVSANQPHILDEFVVGRVFNTTMDGQKLRAEAWLDPEALMRLSPEALGHIRAGKPLDVSVGVFTDEDMQAGEWDGEKYEAVARNHRPDHLALLPGGTGACSWADGCGVRVNEMNIEVDGGPGSGNFGHSGIPGQVGGSGSGGSEWTSERIQSRWEKITQEEKEKAVVLAGMGNKNRWKTRIDEHSDHVRKNLEKIIKLSPEDKLITTKSALNRAEKNNPQQNEEWSDMMQTNAIKFDNTESIPWTKPTLADFGKGGNWPMLDQADKTDIANHFLIGDDSAANYGELMFPVVNPRSGKLNENALRAVIGGRGAQANITAAQRISARRQAYRLLNSEFDAKLDVPQNLELEVDGGPGSGNFGHGGIPGQQGGSSSGGGGGTPEGATKDMPRGLNDQGGAKAIQGDAIYTAGSNKPSFMVGEHNQYYLVTSRAPTQRDFDNPPLNGAIHKSDVVKVKDTNYSIRSAPRVNQEQLKSMASSGLSVNDMGYRELSQAIQTKLDRMDDDTKVYYLEDTFDGYIIYRVEPKNGGSADSKTLFKRDYTVAADGTVEFTGESQPVIKRVSYDPASQRGGVRNMSKQPCCAEKVQMLIESGFYEEADRDRLMAMEEADINVLTASMGRAEAQVNAEKEKVTALEKDKAVLEANTVGEKQTREQAIQTLKADLGDQEKLMAILPPQTKAVISHSLRLYEVERDRKIQHILDNTVEGIYTKEALATMDDQGLDSLARAVKAPVDYSAMAPTPLVNAARSPQGYEAEAVYPPEVG